MRLRLHLVGFAAAVALAIGLSTVPVHATVHEIVAQWCSGQDELAPPGISDDQKKNFARPLFAARIVVRIVDNTTQTVLITFDYGHAAIKVRSTGATMAGTGFGRSGGVRGSRSRFVSSGSKTWATE